MDNLATTVSAWLRQAWRHALTARARLEGKAFHCRALAGRSEINICINSDLTVSCNCHDVDGTGHIGDLTRQSLAECFSGTTADRFRRQLAAGRLPIANCARCCDLRMVDRSVACRLADRHRLPRFVMVENTSACNLRCVSCPRTTVRNLRRKLFMSLDDVRLVAEQLSEVGVRRVAYLNLGEPFLSRTIRQELEIIRQENPGIEINTSTNALVIDSEDKRRAALLIDRMQVSLDGVSQETVTRYQRGSDFERAYCNMRALVSYRDRRGASRPLIIWKYLLFRWNESPRHVAQALQLARQANVDRILFERTVSPFYGIPYRSYLGLHRRLGQAVMGDRLVLLRR